jgi:ADP-ribosylglycohydrolase
MSLSPTILQDRFRAALLGVGIGDALGFPQRGVPPESLSRLRTLADDFAPRPRGRYLKGQFSAHTQLLLATSESLIRENKLDGRSVAAHFAWLWQEGVILQPSRSVADALNRLGEGSPWMSAGAPLGVKDASVLPRAVALGLWKGHDFNRIAHEAGVLTVVTHKDPTCAAAASAVARGVALALVQETQPGEFCLALARAAAPHDSALAQELQHLPRLLTWEVGRAFEQLRRVGVPVLELQDEPGLTGHVTPVLLVAVYAALRFPKDFREALTQVLRLGGCADTAAALCGGLLGAQLGTEGLPVRLRRGVLYAEHLRDVADRLSAARIANASGSSQLIRTPPRKQSR